MHKIERKNFIFHIFLFTWVLILSGGTLPLNDLLQPPGHAVHDLHQVFVVIHLGDPEPLDCLNPLVNGGAGGALQLQFHPAPHILYGIQVWTTFLS